MPAEEATAKQWFWWKQFCVEKDSRPLRFINISGDRARIPSPVNDLSPKTWRFVTRFTSQS